MARTSTRQWKGCPMCKEYKHAAHGPSVRQPRAVLQKIGKSKRVGRKDLGDQER